MRGVREKQFNGRCRKDLTTDFCFQFLEFQLLPFNHGWTPMDTDLNNQETKQRSTDFSISAFQLFPMFRFQKVDAATIPAHTRRILHGQSKQSENRQRLRLKL